MSFSGAMLGNCRASASYFAENFASNFDSASFIHLRIGHSGCV